MSRKVDQDLERPAIMEKWPGRQSPRIDIQGDMPPVVSRRGRGGPNFPDDLREDMERLLSRTPICDRDGRKGHVGTMRGDAHTQRTVAQR